MYVYFQEIPLRHYSGLLEEYQVEMVDSVQEEEKSIYYIISYLSLYWINKKTNLAI
jgi:hypothetical protein